MHAYQLICRDTLHWAYAKHLFIDSEAEIATEYTPAIYNQSWMHIGY